MDTAEPHMPHRQAFNPEVLLEMLGEDFETIFLALEEFLTDFRLKVALMETAHLGQDLKTVAAEAHRLKGAACYIGAGEFRDAAARVEDAVRDGQQDVIPEAVRNVRATGERLCRHLSAWLVSRGCPPLITESDERRADDESRA